jgi:hypothetical protein
MPSVDVNLKAFEFGTKLVATFVVEQTQHVQRFMLLPTVDGIDTSSGKLIYATTDQLLELREYHGTIGPTKIALQFTGGVCIYATLKTPMDHQVIVKVTEHDTAQERKALEQLFGNRTSHLPMLDNGPKLQFKPVHVYVDYLLGPSPFFWRG